MDIAKTWEDYEIIDASCGEKYERWGKYYLLRPDPQVVWDNGNLLEKYPNIEDASIKKLVKQNKEAKK